MINPTQIDQKSKKRESAFCFWILIFILFEVVFVTAVLIGSFSKDTPTEDPQMPVDPPVGDTTTAPIDPTPPPGNTPVFSGGVMPTLPKLSASTQTVTGGIYSEVAFLYDTETGEILAQKGGEARFYPASLTKVMTLIVACENLKSSDLDRKLVLRQELWDYVREGSYEDTSVAGFDAEDEIKIIDLLYGIGMKSASDCCMLIADDIAGSEAAFVQLMNDKVAEMGLSDTTHFDNVIGHESEQNYSTARDMAVIMAYAMQNDLIANILSAKFREFRVSYYKTPDNYTDYRFTYNNSLFSTRMERYEESVGKAFTLSTAELIAGKTGSFIVSSNIVCEAAQKNGNGRYILVLGNATQNGSYSPTVCTMCDIKYMLDTYVK